jgi:sigma-B regulation protein RsbU (phosphoserine phosphatase)
MNILVVDDEPISLRVVSALLAEHGHRVVTATDGAAALALFEQETFQAVVTDWVMPVMDGLELVRRIRDQPLAAYTYVVVLTARGAHEDAIAALDAGADDLLPKPVQRDDLDARLRVAQRIIALQEQLLARNRELLGVNQRMKKALDAAVAVQRSLLPTRLPQIPGMRFAWRADPCDELGGDTLNLFQLDEHHLSFYVLDVSGHGVSSALLAVQVSRLLSPVMSAGSMLKVAAPSPKRYRLVQPMELLRQLTAKFPLQVDAPQFFTMLYGMYDLRTHQVVIASAGHPGPVLVHADGVAEPIRVASHPIGWFDEDEAEFAEVTLTLAPGDRLVLFSDGVIEAGDEGGAAFGIERLSETLERRRDQPLDQALPGVIADLATWRRGGPQTDDISLLAIERDRVPPSPGEVGQGSGGRY